MATLQKPTREVLHKLLDRLIDDLYGGRVEFSTALKMFHDALVSYLKVHEILK